MKKVTCILLILIFLLSTTAFAASDEADPINENISREHVSNGQYPVNRGALFTAKYGQNWIVSMDKDSNLPKRMVGSSIELAEINKDGTEPQVRKFIADNIQFLGLDPSDMELIKEDHDSPLYAKGDGINNIVYQQSYKGVPVYSSRVGVTVSDGNIVSVNSNYFPDITAPTEPAIDEKQALSAIASDLGIDVATPVAPLDTISMEEMSRRSGLEREAIKAKDISIVIYPLEKEDTHEYHLAYKVELNTIMEPLGSWVYFVDAIEGQILYRYDRITPYTIEGHVTGAVYPEHPSQTPVNVPFWNQTISIIEGSDKVLYSGRGSNLLNIAVTTDPIDLTGAVNSTLNFSTRYDTELNYDYAYVLISEDGNSLESEYYVLKSYSGDQSSWINESICISEYDGKMAWIGFAYVTDLAANGEGFYADNITVSSENGLVFSDDLDNSTGNWNLIGFSVKNTKIYPKTKTDNSGYYNITGLEENTTIYSELSGPYAKVVNADQANTFVKFNQTTPTYDWNWADIDTSDRREESNVFYHVNVIHDYFTRGTPFDIHSMDYQTIATVGFGSESGNAFSDHTNIYLFSGDETYESTALLSDVIYHEYTHSVVRHVYTTHLPYINESGALNEGWADYFACTINNNSVLGEGFFVGNTNGLRDLNKTYRYPDDIFGEVHYDSQIISGAMWDMREMLGAELSDELVIRGMKLEPQNFQEYLEGILIVDDDNADLSDGTPHINEICTAFYVNHGIHTELFNRTSPEVSGEYPESGSYINNSTTTMAVNITGVIDIDPSSINMKVNGNPVIPTKIEIINGYRVENITYTPYDDGNVTVWINASDNAENPVEYSWSFFVDTRAPTSNTPENMELLANSTANFIQWKLFDTNPGYYWVNCDEEQIVPPQRWTNSTNITVPADTSIGFGDFNYTILYNDTAGNYGKTDIVSVNIRENTAPYAIGEIPANGSFVNNTSPLISINIMDDASGVNKSSIAMKVNSNDVEIAIDPIANGYNAFNLTPTCFAHEQTVNVVVNATDNSSNSVNCSWSFTIDMEDPTIDITSHLDGSSTTSGSIIISGIANGTGSPAYITVNGLETPFEGENGTFTQTVPLSPGNNTIYANVTDLAGNINTTSINVTRTSPKKSKSSGGSGGGGTTGEAYENIQKKEVRSQFVNKDDDVSYNFEEEENDIDHIRFDALKNSGKISVTIEVLEDRSSKVDKDPEGKVYSHMNIWVGKAGFATEQNIADPVIGFKVRRSWINDNNIDGSTIVLNRYHDGEWNQLTTTKIGEDEEYLHFEAKTPGFSPFAITGEEKEVPITQKEPAKFTSSTVEDENAARNTEVSSAEQTDVPAFSSKIALVAGVLILLIGYFKRKSLSRKLKR